MPQPQPGQLEALLAQGFQIGPDGSLIPPMMGGNGMPNAGAMRGAGNVPPPPMAPPMPGAAPVPPNPSMMADPMQQMMQSGPAMMGGQEAPPPPPVNLSVPGGASIVGGNPQAAKPPVPPAFKPTYNVTMATEPESARMQYQTEVQRGQNHTAKRDYEEMNRARKVNLYRGMFGNR
jgi:hypothetical protein